ncbi:hypothetical protein B296_00049368 [Ensete ventricosum]|uniref:Transmembrane protein n=1 Tax=Ensete ventricosum TaxID=4639 RepID=A0A426YR05_ENSVE|nr:hypothetical protein B296_00049368 [Ensete ventricosum]
MSTGIQTTSDQLSTLNDPSIYVGNKDLCGCATACVPWRCCLTNEAHLLQQLKKKKKKKTVMAILKGVLEITSIVMRFVVGFFWHHDHQKVLKGCSLPFDRPMKTCDWVSVQLNCQ